MDSREHQDGERKAGMGSGTDREVQYVAVGSIIWVIERSQLDIKDEADHV